MKRKLLFSIVLVLFLFSNKTIAQKEEKPVDATGLYDTSLEELLNIGIVSASRKKQSVQDAPAMAYVVTDLQIKSRGYQNLLDLPEDVPEIEVQRNNNAENRNTVSVRGVSGNEKILVLMNGIRITPATGDNYTLGANFSLVNARRVEVILGPASALYGVDAFSGIVNIITKSQDGIPYKGAEISTSYGNYNTTNNSFMSGAKVDKLSVNVSGNYYYSAEPNYNKIYTKDYAWYNNQYQPAGQVVESPYYNDIYNVGYFQHAAGNSFQGDSLSRKFSMPTQAYNINAEITYDKFTVGYFRSSERHSSSYSLDPKYASYAKDGFIEQMQEVIYGRHAYTSFNKKWGLQTTFTQNFYELNPNSNYQGSASRWQRGYIYSNGQSSKIEEQFNYDFSKKVSLIAGGSFERLSALPHTGLSPHPYDKNQPAALQDIYYIGAAGYTAYPAPTDTVQFQDSLAVKQNQYNLTYHNLGTYAQMQLSPAKFLDITLGARYDNNSRFGSTFNPRLGLVITPVSKIKIKLLYGESYLAPSPKKAYEQSGAFFGNSGGVLYADYIRVPNPNLKPEKLRSFDFSFNYFVTKNLSFAVNSFYTKLNSLINLNGTGDPSQAPPHINATHLEMSVNQGNQVSYGGTARVNYLVTFNKLKVNNFVAYSYVDGYINKDVDQDGIVERSVLQFAAPHTVKGGIEISYKKFSIVPRAIFRSASYGNITDSYDKLSYAKNQRYIVFNLSANYQIVSTKKIDATLFVNIKNLGNSLYYNPSSGNEQNLALAPQDPFRMMGGITLAFK